MITADSIIKIGQLVKPHGIKGEITASLDYDIDLMQLRCIVIPVDAIFVPFFVESERPKSTETAIIKIDGIDSDVKAKGICGCDYYALRDDVDIEHTLDEFGGYISDFIGFELYADNGVAMGEITGYDDSTENFLFEITMQDGRKTLVPVADDLIENIDPDGRKIVMSLPDGLFDL